jgi:ribonucleoside-diphosphate reductase alpha chain
MKETPQTPTTVGSKAGEGLSIERRFTTPSEHPFDGVEWELRNARIGHGDKVSFEQREVEFPKSWSQNATNIVAQKYFRGQPRAPERERSVKQMIGRVSGTIATWGRERGYFATDADADTFEAELTHILLHQMAAFNSPVWFNVGWHPEGDPKMQASACFILSVQDTMESILEWNTKEGIIFRGGSGSGINLSRIRGSMEPLSRGGTASGPVSFMRGADAWAGQDGRARCRPPGHPRVHLVQGQGGGQGRGAARRRVRHVDRRRRVLLDPVPEREQLGARHRRLHARGGERRRLAPDRAL